MKSQSVTNVEKKKKKGKRRRRERTNKKKKKEDFNLTNGIHSITLHRADSYIINVTEK